MKKFLAALLIGLSLVSITLDASAARLGGGASFGRSMSVPKAAPSTPFKAPSAAATKRPATAAAAGAAAKAPMSMGKRLLIGAAAALGFMALANMLGLGEGFAQMLMILTLILLPLWHSASSPPARAELLPQHLPALLPLSRLRMPTSDKAEAKPL